MRLGLNIGSGGRPFSSTPEVKWVNIDCQEKCKPDIVADASSLPMIQDGSVDYVVLQHTLEHYGSGEGVGLLKEAYRVLCHLGSLVVTVPDMRALAEGWIAGKITTETYMINVYGGYMGSEADRHKFGFTKDTLVNQIMEASSHWRAVMNFDGCSPPGADISRDWWILGVEAIK
jgi:predicted SAM-dependent methyltransferase